MIIHLITIATTIIIAILIKNKRPLKLRFIILLLTNIIFIKLTFNSGRSWIPLLFIILFTGGILLIFIILSSIIPNQKSKKFKPKIKIIIFIIINIALREKLIRKETEILNQIKSFLTSGINIIWITTVILIYFLRSIIYINTEETPLRTIQCWKKN